MPTQSCFFDCTIHTQAYKRAQRAWRWAELVAKFPLLGRLLRTYFWAVRGWKLSGYLYGDQAYRYANIKTMSQDELRIALDDAYTELERKQDQEMN